MLKSQILAIYGSAQHLVRLKWSIRIIEEDWKIQKIALNWYGWFFGPNFWHRYSMGWHYSEKKFRGGSGQNWPHPVTFSDVGEIPTLGKNGSKNSKFEKINFLHAGHTKNPFCAKKSDSGYLRFSSTLSQTETAQSYYRRGLENTKNSPKLVWLVPWA